MKLCLFVHHDNNYIIQNYVHYYLKELNHHFDKIIFISNIKNCNVENSVYFKNNSGDLIQHGQYLLDNDITKYDEIALINDSCVLFKPLDIFFKWKQYAYGNVLGFTDSYEYLTRDDITHLIEDKSISKDTANKWEQNLNKNNHHIQSYFLYFDKKSIKYLKAFFDLNLYDLSANIESKEHILKQSIDGEIGLSRFLNNNGLMTQSLFRQPYFNSTNIMYENYKELIEMGMPMIKRKIIGHDNIVSAIYGDSVFSGWQDIVKRKVTEEHFKYIFQ
jgi:lipopolysaccharide biosynthesis protein